MAQISSRRAFLQSAMITGSAAMLAASSGRRLPIGFSTLGCPKWTWATILDVAARNNFASIELRGLQGEMDLTKRPEFAGRIEQSKREIAARNLRISCLGSSARMHEMDKLKRDENLDEGRRFIDLAHRLGAPYVRVFGDKRIEGIAQNEMIAHVASGLRALGDYARGKKVMVLIESHGDYTDSPSLLEILQKADSPAVGLLWDAHHTFAASGEDPAYTLKQLGKYIRHTHLKDSRLEKPADNSGTRRRYVLTGEGDVPVRKQVRVLAASGYKGFYSFEWEKMWHPEIEEPEIAIPHYAERMREYMANSRP